HTSSTLFPYTTLFRSPDHLGERKVPDQLFDRIASHVNLAGLNVDDRSGPPRRCFLNDLGMRLRAHIAPDARRPSMSPSLYPISRDRKSTRLNSSHRTI